MPTNKITYTLPADQWSKVATDEKSFIISKLSSSPSSYLWTYKINGGQEPTTILDGSILFEKSNYNNFNFNNVVDFYIYPVAEEGKISIGIFDKTEKTRELYDNGFIIEQYISRKKVDIVLDGIQTGPLALNTDAEYQIKVVDSSNILVGDWIEIYQENPNIPYFAWIQAKVLAKSGTGNNTITLDRPVGYQFDPTDTEDPVTSRVVEINMNVDGSSTRQIFKLQLPVLKKFAFEITRAMITGVHDSEPDNGNFLGYTELVNGVVFGGSTIYPTLPPVLTYKTLTVIRNGDDLTSSAYDVSYTTRASPQNPYGTSVRRTFGGKDKNDVAVPLIGGLTEISAIIQDDLRQQTTGINTFAVKLQGKLIKLSDLQL